jgi:hypothetical protein
MVRSVDPGTFMMGMSKEYWDKLYGKVRITIGFCIVDSVLLNVSCEDIAKKPWDKLGNFHLLKSLVKKLFLQKNLYLLSMSDGRSIKKNMNAFNIVISQLLSMDIEITKEENV